MRKTIYLISFLALITSQVYATPTIPVTIAPMEICPNGITTFHTTVSWPPLPEDLCQKLKGTHYRVDLAIKSGVDLKHLTGGSIVDPKFQFTQASLTSDLKAETNQILLLTFVDTIPGRPPNAPTKDFGIIATGQIPISLPDLKLYEAKEAPDWNPTLIIQELLPKARIKEASVLCWLIEKDKNNITIRKCIIWSRYTSDVDHCSLFSLVQPKLQEGTWVAQGRVDLPLAKDYNITTWQVAGEAVNRLWDYAGDPQCIVLDHGVVVANWISCLGYTPPCIRVPQKDVQL